MSTAQLVLRRVLTRLVDPSIDQIAGALEQSAAEEGAPKLARASLLRLGFVPLGRWLVRCDVLEPLREARRERDDQALAAHVSLLLGRGSQASAQLVRALGRARERAT